MSELAIRKDTQVAEPNLLQAVLEAARDPTITSEKLMGLIDVNERLMNKQAELEFNTDFVALQGELPRITKDAKIMHSGKIISSYSTYEHIDTIIRPILKEFGFGVSYNSVTATDGKIIVSGRLMHKGGHSTTGQTPPMGLDSSGAKNNVQGVGSTIAYGKRYLIGMMLNLVFEGDDDDGTGGGRTPISSERAQELKDLLREKGALGKDVKDICRICNNAESIDDIAAVDFAKAKNAISVLPVKELQR